MHRFTRTLAAWTLGALALACGAPSRADDSPVRLVVPYAPGGSADQIARLIAVGLSQRLNVTVVVDNKPGAGGILAADHVAKSAPDGKTFLVGSNAPLVINMAVYPKLPYDPERDFTPVVALVETPLMLVTRKSLPVGSVAELQKYAKAAAAKPLTMGSAGNGNITHLGGEYIASMLGFSPLHVPYKGSAPAIGALMGGDIDIMFDALPSSLAQARGGTLNALAVTSAHRLASLPSVPTLRELGFEAGKVTAWFGIVAPAKTPPAVIKQFNAAANAALAEAGMKDKLAAIGFEPMGGSPDEFGLLIRSEIKRWVPLARSLNVKAD